MIISIRILFGTAGIIIVPLDVLRDVHVLVIVRGTLMDDECHEEAGEEQNVCQRHPM